MHRRFPRLLGLLLLAASGGSTLAHRALFAANRTGPAHPAEFGLGLLTFLFASAGMLLLLHGVRLFASPAAMPARVGRRRRSGDATRRDPRDDR